MTQPLNKHLSIFICYRRKDAGVHAHILYERLRSHFGQRQVFIDDDIEPGEAFKQRIREEVNSCRILLAIIGKGWLSANDGTSRRLDDPEDYVRLEIATALKRPEVRVIPILVDDADMPGPKDLPADLFDLADLNAHKLKGVGKHDLDHLVEALEKVLTHSRDARRLPTRRPDIREADGQSGQSKAARGRQGAAAATGRQSGQVEPASPRVGEAVMGDHLTASGSVTHAPYLAAASGEHRLRMLLTALLAAAPALLLVSVLYGEAKRLQGSDAPPAVGDWVTCRRIPTPSRQIRERTNDIGMEFVQIPPGVSCRGSDVSGNVNEQPVGYVSIGGEGLWMGKYEVTQAQWRAVMGGNPSLSKNCGGDCPVERVSWVDAQKFVRKLNEKEDGLQYRLPTEAEWEYACRAGTDTAFAFGESLVRGQANVYDPYYDSKGWLKTTRVGTFIANDFGLYDMHGNVQEWCEDHYLLDYKGAPTDGSARRGEEGMKLRVKRGGSWNTSPAVARCAYRSNADSTSEDGETGLRIVATLRP